MWKSLWWLYKKKGCFVLLCLFVLRAVGFKQELRVPLEIDMGLSLRWLPFSDGLKGQPQATSAGRMAACFEKHANSYEFWLEALEWLDF